jgi:hypothetical protein
MFTVVGTSLVKNKHLMTNSLSVIFKFKAYSVQHTCKVLHIPNPLLIYLYLDYFLWEEISYLEGIHFKLFLQSELITDNEDHLPLHCHLEVRRRTYQRTVCYSEEVWHV